MEGLGLLMLVVCVFWYFHDRKKRHALRTRTFEEELAEELSTHGFSLVESIVPPRFVSGPFPQGMSSAGAISCEDNWQYRVVHFRDKAGTDYQAWARLFITHYHVNQIDWHPDLTQPAEWKSSQQEDARFSSEPAASSEVPS